MSSNDSVSIPRADVQKGIELLELANRFLNENDNWQFREESEAFCSRLKEALVDSRGENAPQGELHTESDRGMSLEALEELQKYGVKSLLTYREGDKVVIEFGVEGRTLKTELDREDLEQYATDTLPFLREQVEGLGLTKRHEIVVPT